MAGEIVESISVLLVDDDVTCLNIVAGLLKSLKYKVVAVKHPIEALFTLRVKAGSFDLVITDVHMPDMNGFELQKKIEEEFNLPVVFMSSDDEESIIVRGLQSGGVFFLVKPISSNDLKNLWQYAVAKKKPKSAIIEEIGSTQESSKADKQAINEINHSPSENAKGSNDAVGSKTSLQNDDWKSTNDFKRKSPENVEEGEDDEYDDSDKSKKTKVWTDELHLKFLEAVKSTGVERAVPKTVLELMNVPGLKRVQVASHLQKYRLFLKKVAETAEANFKIQSPSETNKVERTFTNNKFASSAPNSKQPLIGNAIGIAKPLYQQADPSTNSTPLFGSGHLKQPLIGNAKPRHQQANPSPNWTPLFGSGQSRPLLNETNSKQMLIGNAKPLYQQANPSANWTPLFGSGQSRPLLSQTNFNQPLIGNAKPFYQQANPCAFRMGSYDQPSSSLPSRKGSISGGIMNGSLRNGIGNISGGIMNGTTFMQPYQQKDQVTPESCANGPITGYGNVKDFANSNLNPRPNHQNSSSYAGLRIASDGRLVGFNLNSGLINELQRKSTSNAPVLNGYSGDYLGQGEPFIGFQNGSIVSPTFDDAIQDDDDTLVMPRSSVLSGNSGDYFGQGPSIGTLSGSTSVMPLSPAILQANTFRNEKESDHISGLLDNELSNNVFGFDDSDLNFLQSYCEGSFNIPDDINIVQPYGEGSSIIPDDINIIQPFGEDSFNIPDDINTIQPGGEDTINILDNINIIQPYGEGSFNTQHDVGALNSAFSFHPDDHVKNNPILLNNDQALGQPSGGEMIFSNFDIDGVDEYFPAFDQTFDRFPPQLDQESLDFLDGIINPRGS